MKDKDYCYYVQLTATEEPIYQFFDTAKEAEDYAIELGFEEYQYTVEAWEVD